MKPSTKMVLAGLAVDMLASWRADVARSASTLFQSDPSYSHTCDQMAQAFEVVAVAGKAAFWYGLYQKAPKLTLAAGALGMAAYYVPKEALVWRRLQQKRAHAASALGASSPPMSAWQGVY